MRILCFGDSNTWGLNPLNASRHPKRWTRVLAALRPEDEVIEEGLNGRTVNSPDHKNPERHGMTALPMVMQSHAPLDQVVIMLGTNEFKRHFGKCANQISLGIGAMIKYVQNPANWAHQVPPKILVVSPIVVGRGLMNHPEFLYQEIDEYGIMQSEYLANILERICDQYGVAFLDAKTVAQPSNIDFVHMDEENHQALGQAIAAKLATL